MFVNTCLVGSVSMLKKTRRLFSAAKAILCIVLVLNLHLWVGGCGIGGVVMIDGKLRVNLTPDQPLTQVLAGSAFEGATAIEIDPATHRFRLIFPDENRDISGQYNLNKGQFSITQFHVEQGSRTADLALNSSKQVTSIQTSTGLQWNRPSEWVGLPVETISSGVDAYVGANIELVDVARQFDGGGGERVPPTPVGDGTNDDDEQDGIQKTGQAAQDATGLDGVLSGLAFVLGLSVAASNFPALYFVFQILVSAQTAMAIAGIAPAPGTPTTGGGTLPGEVPTGAATLLVINELTDGTPIWFVTLIEDSTTGAAGGNLLGDEAIPAGSFKTFAVPSGTRDINIIVPNGVDCFVLYENQGISLVDEQTTEIVITDVDAGQIIPDGCEQ